MNAAANGATWMARETAESGDAVARLLDRSGDAIRAAGKLLRDLDPRLIAICARGSSNHAAAFFKYATETQLGLPVVAIGPSIASVYQTPLRLDGAVMLVISQSGRSPDLLAMAKAAQQGGAKIIAIVNDADFAGGGDGRHHHSARGRPREERRRHQVLHRLDGGGVGGAGGLVDATARSAMRWRRCRMRCARRWPPTGAEMVAPFVAARSALIIGRGIGYPIAMEAALKLKETASPARRAVQRRRSAAWADPDRAQGFPGAAVPAARRGRRFARPLRRPVGGSGRATYSWPAPAAAQRASRICRSRPRPIRRPSSCRRWCSCYATVDRIARARGFDPDTPPLLKKVTETL